MNRNTRKIVLLELKYISIKGYLDTMYEIPNSLNVCRGIS